MTGNLQPLSTNFQIVDDKGMPTQYFVRWAQQKQLDIKASVSGIKSSTNNAVVRWKGASGTSIQDSGVTIDNSNNLYTPGTITAGANSTGEAASFEGPGLGLSAVTFISLKDKAGTRMGYLGKVISGSYDIYLASDFGNFIIRPGSVNAAVFTPLGVTVTGQVTVTDDAYDPDWAGSVEVPTKNAVYTKIQSLPGGGGSSTTASTIVQQATLRVNGNGTLNLPGAPTAGNLLALIWCGPGGGNKASPPTGYALQGYNCNGGTIYSDGLQGLGAANQGAWVATRRVQAGDTAALVVNAPSDNQNWLLLELNNCNVVDFYPAQPQMTSSTAWKVVRRRPAYKALHILVIEHDGTPEIAFDSVTGVTVLYTATPGATNHKSTMASIGDTNGDITGTFSAAPSSPLCAHISFAIY